MRLALLVLYVHFFFAGTLAGHAPTQFLSLDITKPQCTRVLQPLLVAAQLFDVINTNNQLRRYPDAREADWWTSRFAGPQGRNIAGIAFGIAALDFIKWKLTARSPALRCTVEAEQLGTTIRAIGATHPR